MAIHQYNGKLNDRSKRQQSKILKGVKRVASPKVFQLIRWEKTCPKFEAIWNPKSEFICDNCGNFKCFRK